MKANTKITIKPCPFCGAEVKKIKGQLMPLIMFLCNNCGATVSFQRAERDPFASLKWNRRPADNE